MLAPLCALAACSAVDTFQYLQNLDDPREGLFRHVDKPVPGTDQPYPNLASVPDAPTVTAKPARTEMQQKLTAEASATTYQPNDKEVPSVPTAPPPLPPGFLSAQKPMQLPPAPPTPTPTPPNPAPQALASNAALPGTTPAFGALGAPKQVAIVLFDAGSARIDGGQVDKLRPIVRMLRQSGRMLQVVGHASHDADAGDRGDSKITNFDLSLDRANAVGRILMRLGVQPGELIVSAEGDSAPVGEIAGVTGEAANQRVDIFLE